MRPVGAVVHGQSTATDPITRHLVTLSAQLDELRRAIPGRRKDFYTVDELADLTGRAPYTVRTWIHAGRVTAIRVAGSGPKGRLLIPS
jgi:excisionase family DNA binding protein